VAFVAVFDLYIDDHGSLIIYRSASVRPKHPFDQNFGPKETLHPAIGFEQVARSLQLQP
jgi:hypothetical protein